VEIGGSVETQIGASGMSSINSPKIVSRAVSGRTPIEIDPILDTAIQHNIKGIRKVKRKVRQIMEELPRFQGQYTYIQSPRRNPFRGLGGLLERVKLKAGAGGIPCPSGSGEWRNMDRGGRRNPICLEMLAGTGDSLDVERSA